VLTFAHLAIPVVANRVDRGTVGLNEDKVDQENLEGNDADVEEQVEWANVVHGHRIGEHGDENAGAL
jgi:hypothetical protein